jgi:Ulp1 protease family, C-terminal catalytic domain
MHDHGNFIADQYADPTFPSRPSNHLLPTLQLTATQVLQHLLLDEDWMIVTENNLPFLGDPTAAVQEANWQGYIQTRDRNRMDIGDPRKWTTLSLQTAARAHLATSSTYTHCSKITKLIYDWYHHGTRAVLGSSIPFPDPLPCPLCKEPDSQHHMICGCTHEPIHKTRTCILQGISTLMAKHPTHSPTYRCMDAVRFLAQPDSPIGSPHYIWIGTWNAQHIAYLKSQLHDIPFNVHDLHHPVVATLSILCRTLASGAQTIVKLRWAAITSQQRLLRRMRRRPRTTHRALIIHTDVSSVYFQSRSANPAPRLRLNTILLPTPALQHADSALATLHTLRPKLRSHNPRNGYTQPTLHNFLRPHTSNTSLRQLPTTPCELNRPSKPPNSQTRRKQAKSPSSRIASPHTPSENSSKRLSPSLSLLPTKIHHSSSIYGTRQPLTEHLHNTLKPYLSRSDYLTEIIPAATRHQDPVLLRDVLRFLSPNPNLRYRDGCLSDSNITSISTLYNTHSPPAGQAGSFFAVDALFFSRLHRPDHSYLYDSTWFRSHPRGSPLLYDTLYIPTNLSGNHWTGIIVDTLRHHVSYYDSLGDLNYSTRVLYYLYHWLKDEHQHLLQQHVISHARSSGLGDISTWTYTINPHPSPQQRNGYDCGIFYLSTILYHIQGRLPQFDHHNIPLFRKQLLYALITQKLPSPHVPLTSSDLPIHTNPIYEPLLTLYSIPRPATLFVITSSTPIIDLVHDDDEHDNFTTLLTGGGFNLPGSIKPPYHFLALPVPDYLSLHPP